MAGDLVRPVLVVDGANVVGAKPNGWWRDRAKAALRLHGLLMTADTSYDDIRLVLEGQAKGGVRAGRDAHVVTVHAAKDGDSALTKEVRTLVEAGRAVVVVTADRALAMRVEHLGARVMSPTWLWSLLDE